MASEKDGIKAVFSVSIWVTSIYASLFMLLAVPCILILKPTLGVVYTLFVALLMIIPLGTPRWAKDFVVFAIESGMEYFSIKIIAEDEEAIKPGRPYMIGYEPHSIIPVALPIVFNSTAKGLPKGLKNCYCLATSAAFRAPLVRSLWWWLGVRAVSRENISNFLSSGKSCVIIPGGVRETQFMEHGKEVAYLSRRHGFVKLAIQAGAPIVPVFVFGQTATYNFWKLGPPLVPAALVNRIARAAGFQPVCLWGRWCSTIPNKVPITVAIGKPIEVLQNENPDKEMVQKCLDSFIQSMRDLYNRHQSAAGYEGIELEIV